MSLINVFETFWTSMNDVCFRKQLEACQQLDQKQRQIVEEAERSHETHEKFLQETISRLVVVVYTLP